MAYYTKYSIKIIAEKDFPQCEHDFDSKYKCCPQCGQERQIISGESFLNKKLIEFLKNEKRYDNPFLEKNTWYNHIKHLAEFSEKYPDALFILDGNGDDNSDIWKKYFKAGKYRNCSARINFDEFDESKMIYPGNKEQGK